MVVAYLWRNQGPQINFYWSGGFFRPGPAHFPGRQIMGNSELSFARQNALTTRDWDTYQLILRKCLRSLGPVPDNTGLSRKTAVNKVSAARRSVAVAR